MSRLRRPVRGRARSLGRAGARILYNGVRGPADPQSRPPHNAAMLLRPTGTQEFVAKQELPNEDLFDEVRQFTLSWPSLPVVLGEVRLGILICEVLRHPGPASRLAAAGAEALLAINGSPFEVAKADRRVAVARARLRKTGLPVA